MWLLFKKRPTLRGEMRYTNSHRFCTKLEGSDRRVLMGNTLKVEIAESLEALKAHLQQQKTTKGQERMQMLYWLKLEPSLTRKTLAQRLNRDQSTVYRWLQTYRQGGIDRLLEVKVTSGPAYTITGDSLEKLKARLRQPHGFASYGEVQQWLEQDCELLIPYSTVHRTVRYRLKANFLWRFPTPSTYYSLTKPAPIQVWKYTGRRMSSRFFSPLTALN